MQRQQWTLQRGDGWFVLSTPSPQIGHYRRSLTVVVGHGARFGVLAQGHHTIVSWGIAIARTVDI
jgi:hypothetical protein